MNKIAKYKYVFAFTDFIILILTLVLSIIISGNYFHIEILVKSETYTSSLFLFFLMTFSILFIFSLNNLYAINLILIRSAHLTAVLRSIWYFVLLLVPALILLLDLDVNQIFYLIISFVGSFLICAYLVRVEFLREIYLVLKRKSFRRNVAILGDGNSGKLLAAKLAFENPMGINIIGFIDDQRKVGDEVINDKKVIGNFANINEVIDNYKIDEMLISSNTDDYEQLLHMVDSIKDLNISVKLTSELFEIIPRKIVTEKYGSLPVINISTNYNNWMLITLKRIFDFTLSFLAMIMLTPIFLVIMFIIKVSSKGPVFYNQIRIGKNGKAFKFFKFRTMLVIDKDDVERKEKMLKFMKQENAANGDTKVISDWRVTKIGKFLRKTSLDELPQLVNVLKGDMSLVGPRPCLPYEYENYDNWQKRRMDVLPGCTGVWQVMGRSSVSFKDSIVLDLYYVNNMSPWLDLQLIIKTLPVMVLGKGGC